MLKRLITLLVAMMLLVSACSKVPAGNVGIKVYLLGTDKGIESEELGVGRYWVGINQELYLFPTFTQNYVWTSSAVEGSENDESITFQTKEGLSVNADIGIAYHIRAEEVNKVFQKFRKGVDEITDVNLRNYVRDAFNSVASTKTVEYVYGAGKSELLTDVENLVRDQVSPVGIELEKISIIGSFRLPKQVLAALNSKIEATQRAEQRENELREAEAEAKKVVAQAKGKAEARLEQAEAEAKANRIVANSLTSQLIEYRKIERWNGALPTVTGEVTPLMDFRSK